jgi:hypothetical protein
MAGHPKGTIALVALVVFVHVTGRDVEVYELLQRGAG